MGESELSSRFSRCTIYLCSFNCNFFLIRFRKLLNTITFIPAIQLVPNIDNFIKIRNYRKLVFFQSSMAKFESCPFILDLLSICVQLNCLVGLVNTPFESPLVRVGSLLTRPVLVMASIRLGYLF